MKTWYKSKTLWTNFISIVAIIGVSYGFEIDTESQAALATGLLAVINIILRLVTKQPIV